MGLKCELHSIRNVRLENYNYKCLNINYSCVKLINICQMIREFFLKFPQK